MTHHIFWELRRVARCGLGTSGQPDTAVGNTGMTKGKARGFRGTGFAKPWGFVRNRRNKARWLGWIGCGISRREFRTCDLSIFVGR